MNTPREKMKRLIDSAPFQATVLTLILANAAILGAETFVGLKASIGPVLSLLDRLILFAFIVEIGLRIFAERGSYFRQGWNLFDITIITISLLAATSGLSALRAFRVLRVLRVITVIPRMRVVVSALLDSIPGIASVGVVLALIVYVFAVISATLYGPDHPERFGDVFAAMYTLFQVMTLEGWPDIAADVSQTHERSWIFFLTFVMIATFTMLNLFVAIVVRVVEEDSDTWIDDHFKNQQAMQQDLKALRAEVAELTARLQK